MKDKKRESCPEDYRDFDVRSHELLDGSEFPVYKEEGYYATAKGIRYTAVYSRDRWTPLTYIRGNMTTHKGEPAFYVSKIVNATEDPYIAIKTLPLVFSALETDLREEGVCWLTSKSLYGLAPLAKRYGFKPASEADEFNMRIIELVRYITKSCGFDPSQEAEEEGKKGWQPYDTIFLEKRL